MNEFTHMYGNAKPACLFLLFENGDLFLAEKEISG